jgi:hypothetical protein
MTKPFASVLMFALAVPAPAGAPLLPTPEPLPAWVRETMKPADKIEKKADKKVEKTTAKQAERAVEKGRGTQAAAP